MTMISKILRAILRGYQRWLSPIAAFLGARCRYYPSCSVYAIQVFQEYPWYRAMWMTLRRLGSCHPWHMTAASTHKDSPCQSN